MIAAITLPAVARIPLRRPRRRRALPSAVMRILRPLALACPALMMAAGARWALAAPYVPQSGAQVVETLPRRDEAQPQELLALRAQLRAAPTDVHVATSLAQRFIAQGRTESDPRYFGYAQAALAPWWTAAAPPPQVRLLRATLLQNTHQFTAALSDLDALTTSDPSNAQAWLTRATVQTVRGDYAAATQSCARLSTLADKLVAYSCLASARANMGQLAASERLLTTVLAQSQGEPAEVRVWSQTLLAELSARRNSPQADQYFRAAVQLSPRDSYLLGAYADYLLDHGRPAEVERLLAPFHRIDSLLLRHALSLKQQGRAQDLLPVRAELQARFGAAALRGDSVHLREQARFTLHVMGDAHAALSLARRNWSTQKELADLRLLLEAARAAGDSSALAEGAAWVRDHRLEDVTVQVLLKGGA